MTDTPEVLRLFPGTHIPGQVDPEIVELLEDLLDQARKGEFIAFAYALVGPQAQGPGALSTGWEGATFTSFMLSAAISTLSHRYHADLVFSGVDEEMGRKS